MSARLTVRLLLLGSGALMSASGGAGQLEGRVFEGAETSYRVGHLGSDWERVHVGQGQTDLAYSNSRLSAVIQLNGGCDPALDIPLEALTKHLLIGFTERSFRSRKRVPMSGRKALETHVVAELDGVPREMLFYVLKKDGCVYDFALVAPPDGRFDRAREDYVGFLGGFDVIEGRIR